MTPSPATSNPLTHEPPVTTLPPVCPLAQNPVWPALAEQAPSYRHYPLRQAFREQADRLQQLTRTWTPPQAASTATWALDLSRNAWDGEVLATLTKLAQAAHLPQWLEALFAGQRVNSSEQRAAAHMALRLPHDHAEPYLIDGVDVVPQVLATRQRMLAFAESVRSGAYRVHPDHAITDVVNLGIGGSDLGPAMVYLALAPFADGPKVHFVSNVDPGHLAAVLATLKPQTTMFILASKTLTTDETLRNATAARAWQANCPDLDVARGFCAVSAAVDKAAGWGIPAERCFGFWDWVGGRYSTWSSVGLPVAIGVGAAQFEQFLAGGHAMDQHFKTRPLLDNWPVLLGLLAVWYHNGLGAQTHAVIPYNQDLARFPAHLQQLDMESNGKSVDRLGARVASSTGAIVWGEPGTNAQHAFFQLIHQGTQLIPIDFILFARSAWQGRAVIDDSAIDDNHRVLFANGVAQTQALLQGRALETLPADADSEDTARAHQREFSGDRPSTTLVLPELSPFHLGALLALYEHRVFVQACLWGINPYDQWGVELGKSLARQALANLSATQTGDEADPATRWLIAQFRAHNA